MLLKTLKFYFRKLSFGFEPLISGLLQCERNFGSLLAPYPAALWQLTWTEQLIYYKGMQTLKESSLIASSKFVLTELQTSIKVVFYNLIP